MNWKALLLAIATAAGAAYAADEEFEKAPYQAELAAAAYALQLGETGNTRRWLSRVPERARHWVWRHLDAASDESLRVIRGHEATVTSVDFDGGGKQLLTADALGWAALWDGSSGREVRRFRASESGLFRAVFSPDGRWVATASADRTCKLWDRAGGAMQRVVWQHSLPVSSVAFSPDGRFLAASSYGMPQPGNPAGIYGLVKVFRTEDWQELYELRGGNKPISCLTWSPDGKRIAASSWAYVSFVWEARSGATPLACDGGTREPQLHHDAVAFSPDGTRLLTGLDDGTARTYDATTGASIRRLTGPRAGLHGVAWSPDGGRCFAAGADGSLRCWDAATGRELASFRGHEAGVRALAISRDGSRLATGSFDGSIRLWTSDAAAYGGDTRLLRNPSASYSVRFSPDGKRLAACGWESIRLWDTEGWRELAAFPGHEASRNALCFTPDSSSLLTASDDRRILKWDAVTGKPAATWDEYPGRSLAIACSPNGATAASGARTGVVTLWDIATGRKLRELAESRGAVGGICFSTDGTAVAAATGEGTLRVWNIADGRLLRSVQAHRGGASALALSPDGKQLASAGRDGKVRTWRWRDLQPERVMAGHDGGVNCVAYSPDGRLLASGSEKLLVHDAGTGGELLERRFSPEAIWALDFSPSGEALALADVRGEIRILGSTPVRLRLAK